MSRLGRTQRDVLDSLRAVERAVTAEFLMEELGKPYGTVWTALTKLLRDGHVARKGHHLRRGWRRGWTAWRWYATPEGLEALRLRELAGYAPGVPRNDPAAKGALARAVREDRYRRHQKRTPRRGGVRP